MLKSHPAAFMRPRIPLLLITGSLILLVLAGTAAEAQLAIGLGGTSGDEGRAVAVDQAGNAYVTGFFNGTVDFDPGPGLFELTAGGGAEAVFVASYEPTGALRYALSFRGEGHGIAVDSAGNVFVTGEIGSGGVDVDPGPDDVILDWLDGRVFVVSYDPTGQLRFGFTVGGGITNKVEGGQAIGLDAAGNLYITGTVNAQTDFDPTAGEEIVPFAGITDSFLASYANDGGIRFANGIGGPFADAGYGLAVDPAGNSYLTGAFRDTLDFDPGPGVESRVANGNRDIYVASYTSTGGFRYAFNVGGGFDDLGNAVAVDAAGNCFVTGSFIDQADFDPGPQTLTLTSAGSEDFFLASYTGTGDLRFAFGLGSSNPMKGFGVAVDALGYPHVTGNFTNLVDFDPGPDETNVAGGSDVFVAGYTGSGEFRYAYNFPDIGLQSSDIGRGIALDNTGQTHIVGSFGSTNDFDPGPGQLAVTSNGFNDAFLFSGSPQVSSVATESVAQTAFTLSRAFPNPTAGRTRFRLNVSEASHVRVAVYDLAGRMVAELHDGFIPAGSGRDLEFGVKELPSGVYFVRVSHPAGEQTSKVMLLR